VLTLTKESVELGKRLARARERAGFTQDEVATLVGQVRPVVSTWESGTRRPNAQQLDKLAAIFRVQVIELLGGKERPRPEFAQLVFRDAGDRLDARGKLEIQTFLAFLDRYGDFLDSLEEAPGLLRSPFSLSEGFSAKEDVRRKAEDARAFFRLGSGPVGDLTALADQAGITVYLAPLGGDLSVTVSGAFLPHDRVGFAILVNTETTPGRRQFTLAHELGHALFHGDRLYVDYPGRREAAERFANAFAAEFLVPSASLRSAVEAMGIAKVRHPEVVVQLQRFFGVSYAMMLVRLNAAHLVQEDDLERLREVQPVHLAERLGYSVDPEEWAQDPTRAGLSRFPRRFLRLLRDALNQDRMTISGAASMTGLAEEEIEDFLSPSASPDQHDGDFEYLRSA
jgi:Zn-dependent peptidase ImmA (M78 family)/transcriptional regulator with XRE-family HTH domain